MTKQRRVRWKGHSVRVDVRNNYELYSIHLKGIHILKRRSFVGEDYQTNRVWSWVNVTTAGTSIEVRGSIKCSTFFDHFSDARPNKYAARLVKRVSMFIF
jgi:hypothetical protein